MKSVDLPARLCLEDSLPYHLRRAAQVWWGLWQETVNELTGPQYTLLATLHNYGSMDQTALGARSTIDRSTLTPLLNRLQMRSWITKTVDPHNQRRRIIELTDDGRRVLVVTTRKARYLHYLLEKQFGGEKTKQLVELLREFGDIQTEIPATEKAGPVKPDPPFLTASGE